MSLEFYEYIMFALIFFTVSNSTDAGDYAQYYEVVEGDTLWRDDIPRSVRYVSISRCGYNHERASTCLDLRDVEAVDVLQLVDNAAGVEEVCLSIGTWARLRSLIVSVPPGTSLRFIVDGNRSSSSSAVGQLGRHQGSQGCMLYWLELEGNVCFKTLRRFERIRSWVSNNICFQALKSLAVTATPVVTDHLGSSLLRELRNLEFLHLSRMPTVQSINVMTCSNLKSLKLIDLPCLRSIGGIDKLTSLKFLETWTCGELLTLTIPDNSQCLIYDCNSLERVSLCMMSSKPGNTSFPLWLFQLIRSFSQLFMFVAYANLSSFL